MRACMAVLKAFDETAMSYLQTPSKQVKDDSKAMAIRKLASKLLFMYTGDCMTRAPKVKVYELVVTARIGSPLWREFQDVITLSKDWLAILTECQPKTFATGPPNKAAMLVGVGEHSGQRLGWFLYRYLTPLPCFADPSAETDKDGKVIKEALPLCVNQGNDEKYLKYNDLDCIEVYKKGFEGQMVAAYWKARHFEQELWKENSDNGIGGSTCGKFRSGCVGS